jgi:uncharacterized protein with HEPN domain
MLKRAIERSLEIIGEAINWIITRDKSYENQITNAKAKAKVIIGLRNQVIHSYDNISDEIIWSILINHLPKLKAEIKRLISEN